MNIYIIITLFIVYFFLVQFIPPDPLHCPNKCGSSYSGQYRKQSLKSHLRDTCGGKNKYQCHICVKRYSSKTNLRIHCFNVHKISIP